jgi:hypothetical protein
MSAASSRPANLLRLACAGGLGLLTACIGTDEQIRTLQQYDAISASPSTVADYDYSVVIRNLEPLGVDMTKVGRERIAVTFLGARCPNGKVVSETEMATTVPGQNSTARDYAVRVKC